jgi:glycosyltransferase involved in cell wall biosynthesis
VELSIIIVAYNMEREIPRTLLSLSKNYQLGVQALEYEVIIVDNGSSSRLSIDEGVLGGVPLTIFENRSSSPSPVLAANQGVAKSSGRLICLMLDGAHILTPGVFQLALAADRAYINSVIATRYFFLGPDEQNISIEAGYNQEEEDRLLNAIGWPSNGYGLFDIGTPFRSGAKNISWLNRMFESNCLFLGRTLFDELGGFDTRFDLPGGGFANLDFFKRACDFEGSTPVQLIGEGSFHQVHGGTTTNTSIATRKKQTQAYRDQFQEIRGHIDLISKKPVQYIGHLPTEGSKIHRPAAPNMQTSKH